MNHLGSVFKIHTPLLTPRNLICITVGAANIMMSCPDFYTPKLQLVLIIPDITPLQSQNFLCGWELVEHFIHHPSFWKGPPL